MSARFAAYSLLLGNFVVGSCVLAPAGMLNDLAAGLGATIVQTGLLVTWGAVVLCFGSPIMATLTSRVDRRTLLAGSALVMAADQSRLGACARLYDLADHPPDHAGRRGTLHAASCRHYRHDGPGEGAAELNRVHLHRLVALAGPRPADHLGPGRADRLARQLCRARRRRADGHRPARSRPAGGAAWRGHVAEELGRGRPQPAHPARSSR